MVQDDRFFQYRLRLFARAREVGVSQACRELGYHRSWYYRWKPLVERHGLEILRPRERRRPRMPNQVPPWLEEPVIAFALGHPGLGPRRIAAQLAQPTWGGLLISASGVQRPAPPRAGHPGVASELGRRLSSAGTGATSASPSPAPGGGQPGDLV